MSTGFDLFQIEAGFLVGAIARTFTEWQKRGDYEQRI
jgi:hypothetical protein